MLTPSSPSPDAAEFVSVSVTGNACALSCEHCNMKVLHGMTTLREINKVTFVE